MRKCLNRVLDAIEEFDLFAPGIALRYKSENDFKTYTGAVVSIALIVFFGIVFANKFIDMVHRNDITSTVQSLEENDPSIFDTSTPDFMFAIGLNSISMNTGLRYFNVLVDQYVSINQTKSKRSIETVPCQADMWKGLGNNYVDIFNRLKMQDWLCPQTNQYVEFQGKYSSEFFKYIRITLTTCSGVVNGMGCHPPTVVQNFIVTNELFGFNYYFINTLINPDSINPISYFLDDSNHFTFDLNSGIACNFYLQSYQMTTDWSLLPVSDNHVTNGAVAIGSTNIFSVFAPLKNEYVRFYIRKSPTSLFITQKFFKFDELLSYIGGLFGLILLFVQVPLTYYNTCCFELALATYLFSYSRKDDEDNPQFERKDTTGSFADLTSGKQNKVGNIASSEVPLDQNNEASSLTKKDAKEQKDLHSVGRFNFLVYLVYLPFFALKNLGWKSLTNKYLTPFYEGIKQVRKHIDLGKMINRFLYLERAAEAVLDADQRMLLHVFPKEDLRQFDLHKSGFKIREKLKEKLERDDPAEKTDPALKGIVDLEELKPRALELGQAYQRLTQRTDEVSRYIVRNMDPDVVRAITAVQYRAYPANDLELNRAQLNMTQDNLFEKVPIPDACLNRRIRKNTLPKLDPTYVNPLERGIYMTTIHVQDGQQRRLREYEALQNDEIGNRSDSLAKRND